MKCPPLMKPITVPGRFMPLVLYPEGTLPWPVVDVWPTNIEETPIVAPVSPNHGFSLAGHGVAALARSYPPGTPLGTHAHAEAQLLFAASGVMQVTTPKGRWLVPPRRAVWVPPRSEHAVDMLSDLEMRSLYIAPVWLAT